MAIELQRGSFASISGDVSAASNGRSSLVDGGDDGSRTARLPRWTRHEILILVQGKRVAEDRVRMAGSLLGSPVVLEPKWASISSYCARHGVNRGPVQCRKRWSNLAGDFKKIKEWESQVKEEGDSFWAMRNDVRRERRLPGFFDREVYNILDGGGSPAGPVLSLALAPGMDGEKELYCAEEAEAEALFDSRRSAAVEVGLFSDFKSSMQEEACGTPVVKEAVPAPIPISERQYQPYMGGFPDQGPENEKQPTSNARMGSTSQDREEGRKRKRLATDGDGDTTSFHDKLVQVLDKNGRILSAQVEAQNINLRLGREQRKHHADSLDAVLNKFADALGRIADKL